MTGRRSFAHTVIGLTALLSLAGLSCRRAEPEDVVARVGDAVLTRSAANAHVDTAGADYPRRLAAYAASWVNAQLVYEEAKRSGVENTESFAAATGEARRQLANQMFLDATIGAESVDVSESALRTYYDGHAAEFIASEEMVKLNIAAFDRRDRASAFIARVGRDTNWAAAVRPADSAAVVPARYYSQHTLYPPELWKAAGSLATGEASFPIKTALGYVVVQPVAVARQGAQAAFDAVRDEVRGRLIMEHRNRRYRELLGTLRQRYAVEVLPGTDVPALDTTSATSHD
jgi:peptidyl-prolyl cis-trans isomerase C